MNKKFFVKYVDDFHRTHFIIVEGASALKFLIERFEKVEYNAL